MIAALSTLVFLATLWLLTVLGAAVLEECGGKIVAALKGELAQPSFVSNPVRFRPRQRVQQPVRVSATFRSSGRAAA